MPVNPKKPKKVNSTQQPREKLPTNTNVNNISKSEIDALKCTLNAKEEHIKTLEFQLKTIVQQHALEMNIFEQANANIPCSRDHGIRSTNIISSQEVDQTPVAQDMSVEEVITTESQQLVFYNETFDLQANGTQLTSENVVTESLIEIVPHAAEITMPPCQREAGIMETISTEENPNEVEGDTNDCIVTLKVENSNLISQAIRDKKVISLLEEHREQHELVYALDRAGNAEHQHIDNNAHIITTMAQICNHAQDCKVDSEELVRTIGDYELNYDESNNGSYNDPKLNEYIRDLAKNFQSSDTITVPALKSFLTYSYKRLSELEHKLRGTTLHRDEMRIANIDTHITIVQLHDQLDQRDLEINAMRAYILKDNEELNMQLEAVQLQCKKYKVCNDNLHSSLTAVSERLMKCYFDIDHLNEIMNRVSSDNLALRATIAEQSAFQKAQNEQLTRFQDICVHEIQTHHTELSSKVDVLKRTILVQAAEYERCNLQTIKDANKMNMDMHKLIDTLDCEVKSLRMKLFKAEEYMHKMFEPRRPTYHLHTIKGHSMSFLQGLLSVMHNYVYLLDSNNKEWFDHVLERDVEHTNVQMALNDSSRALRLMLQLSKIADFNGPIEEFVDLWLHEFNHLKMSVHAIVSKSEDEIEDIVYKDLVRIKKMLVVVGLQTPNKQLSEENDNLILNTDANSSEKQLFNGCHGQSLLEEKVHKPASHLEETQVGIREQQISDEIYSRNVEICLLKADVDELMQSGGFQSLEQVEMLHVDIGQRLQCEISAKDSVIVELQNILNKTETFNVELMKQVASLSKDAKTSQTAVDWQERYIAVEALVGPFRQQLEEFDSERLALESKKEAADNEVKMLAQKYADILGHQNHKQKIRHVAKLKQDNLELKQKLSEVECKLRSKNKAIDKLKEEVTAFQLKEKKLKESLTRNTITHVLRENSPHRPV